MLDPVAGFSLAASVLQVINFSAKTIQVCRELHKTGSLAQYQDIEDIIDALGMWPLVFGGGKARSGPGHAWFAQKPERLFFFSLRHSYQRH